MKQENIEMEEQKPTIGQSLHTARVSAGLSVEDVAQRLKLTTVQISKLEQDEYQDLGPVTFTRGYIKSYSSLLGLDAHHLLDLMDAPKAPEATKKMQSFSRRTEKEASDNRLMVFSYLILALVLGSSGIWYWQTSDEPIDTKGQTAPEATVSESVEQQTVIEKNIETVKENPDTVAQSSVINTINILDKDNTEVSLQTTLLDDSPVIEQVDVQPKVENLTPQSIANKKDASLSIIIMRFSDDSWVEIFDATEQRVAFGVKKAGYTMTVQGKAPFSVVLGKHQVVDVELDGQLVDLSALPRNRLAKFKLPLAE
ncbi:Cytoskeleton protein RodZ [Pseudoalteromonas holothuriae]|uniref:Cytoskeleton protein RodZ n=1 Tax=Pseudoalteromonas holothuriae TaxID=2963714 RepID=A0ABN8UKY8_9GAMM|nr:RodZ domain-containing protein [Pseudoalteromonas sp. CIP111951]CAH9051389.1 Cytoskeleton protein RodZ [Pseudoalteromonas sp. CIP111951]